LCVDCSVRCRCPRTLAPLTKEPLAVGRDAIFAFLDADKGGTDVMELDGHLYEHEQVYVTRTRTATSMCSEAATVVCGPQDELDKRFLNEMDNTKNWLMNDAVLAATIFTPGGGWMLKKVAKRRGQGDTTDHARAAVGTPTMHVQDDRPAARSRRGVLESERKRCRLSLIGCDSEESRGTCDDTPGELAMRELDLFLMTVVPDDNDGTLGVWAARRDDNPLLHIVACSLIGASGSSFASERDFSVAGLGLRRDRSTLLAEHVEMHCLVRFNAHLLPWDLSLIPRLSQDKRSSARANMQPLTSEMSAGGTAPGASSASDSNMFLDESDFEDGQFLTVVGSMVGRASLLFFCLLDHCCRRVNRYVHQTELVQSPVIFAPPVPVPS